MSAQEIKTILIISPEQPLTEALSSVLQGVGYEILLAHDGATVVDALSGATPALIILDVGALGADGLAILEGIRSSVKTEITGIPVIIASQNGDLVEIGAALKIGIQDYFVKATLDTNLVLQKVQKIVAPVAPPFTSIADMNNHAPSVAAAPAAERQTKLLIVEDDKFLRDLASQKIAKEGLTVFAAVDGEQGITMAEKEIPDIILLDILLPGIDGFEVLRRIRANVQLGETRVAMLSNFGQREDIEKALNAGADQFLVKANYTLDEIVDEVKQIISSPRKERPQK